MLKYLIFLTTNILLAFAAYNWFKVNIQVDAFIKNIHHINIFAIFMSSIPYFLLMLAYAMRTQIILKLSFMKSFSINIIGHGLNNVCPFRLGEVFKILFARRFYRISLYELGFSTFTEKTIDLVFLSCLGFIYITLTHNFNNFGILICMFIAALIIMHLYKKRLFIDNPFWKKIYLYKYLKNLFEAVEHCNVEKNLTKIFLLSMIIWLLNLLIFDFYFRFQLENINFSYFDSIFMLLMTTLAFAVPISLGNFGIFEGVVVYYLQTKFQITTEYALALALILHISIVLPQLLGMLINVLYKEGQSLYLYIYNSNRRLNSTSEITGRI